MGNKPFKEMKKTKDTMKQLGISRMELSKKINCSRAIIWRFLNGYCDIGLSRQENILSYINETSLKLFISWGHEASEFKPYTLDDVFRD